MGTKKSFFLVTFGKNKVMKNSFEQVCPFCEHHFLYKIQNHTYRCARCHKKYSAKKLDFDYEALKAFCQDHSVNSNTKALHVNYKNIKERYMAFRKLCFLHSEKIYSKKDGQFDEYDEYYYLPQNKRGQVKYLFEAIGILGMVYKDKIYTLLLPDQFLHLRAEQDNKNVNLAYLKEYAKYLNRYKIVHFEKFDSLVINFWVFLEKKLAKYKGIKRENFSYYLKEYECKFNYTKEELFDILWEAWIDSKR